jgi:hypothetical protein
MYSLDCDYFDKEFGSVTLLLEYALSTGMDPNYAITRAGKPTGEMLIDYIMF